MGTIDIEPDVQAYMEASARPSPVSGIGRVHAR
jgi:hypothetical protein